MRVNLRIEYEVEAEAERGETKADEDRTMELVEGMVQGFAEEITSRAGDQGIGVRVSKG